MTRVFCLTPRALNQFYPGEIQPCPGQRFESQARVAAEDFPNSISSSYTGATDRGSGKTRVEIYSSGFQMLDEITEMNRKRGRLVDYQ